MAKRCKICSFFNKGHGKYRVSERETFRKMIREGKSLKELSQYLEFLGLEVSRETTRQHILRCTSLEIREQRASEIEIKKEGKGIRGKLRNIFSKPYVEPSFKCPHKRTELFFDTFEEVVKCRCIDCRKILSGSLDPHRRRRNQRYRDLTVLEALWT